MDPGIRPCGVDDVTHGGHVSRSWAEALVPVPVIIGSLQLHQESGEGVPCLGSPPLGMPRVQWRPNPMYSGSLISVAVPAVRHQGVVSRAAHEPITKSQDRQKVKSRSSFNRPTQRLIKQRAAMS
jgi:hypothetical protein